MITIDYKEISKKYNQILTSIPRGFDTKNKFLKTPTSSVNLIQRVSDLLNLIYTKRQKQLQKILLL